ncbi:uncharacterized protein LOC132715142 [Ruditapes philippinarum]|uniref:uncharacterized protein LOC132715142 n=1 Tax=Ruditapes philippinarum TaxID=129788 RepID=UPI00295A8C6D|nr:uncharacterized protein LOC132715142 [Ruditapes philippinarum]
MFATIIWEDKKWSIISLRSVLKPRKEVEDYKVGDHVSARFAGKIYAAVIFEIDTDRQALKKKLEDPGFENTLARFLAQQQESRTEAINESEDVEPVKATSNKQKKTDSSKVSDSNKRQNQQAEIMSTNDDQPSSTSYDGKRKLDSSELSVTDQRAMEVLKKRRPACQPVLNPSAVPSLPLINHRHCFH